MVFGKFATLTTLAAISSAAAIEHTYTFDPATAGGVGGTIKVNYMEGTKAKVSADLDFSKVKLADITAADANCVDPVTEYKWHIHVKWADPKVTSTSFAGCSADATGGHYDPLYACGSASEYAKSEKCVEKGVDNYSCTPEKYAADPAVCEKGDLGGKFGAIKLDKDQKFMAEWTDMNFPMLEEYTMNWNMLLHAACPNKAAPRIACATAKDTTPTQGGGDVGQEPHKICDDKKARAL